MKSRRQTTGRSRRVRALLSCGIVLGAGAVGTTALWSTSVTTVSNAFTTANVEILANQEKTHRFRFDGELLPGDSTAALVQVQNVGSVPVTYTASVYSGDAVGAAMQLTAVRGGSKSGTGCAGGSPVVSNTNVTAVPKQFWSSAPATLAPATGVETWCFRLTLPTTADGSIAGAGGDVAVVFDATGRAS